MTSFVCIIIIRVKTFRDYLNGMNYKFIIYLYVSYTFDIHTFFLSNSDKENIEITLVRVWREKSSPDDNDGIQRLMSN